MGALQYHALAALDVRVYARAIGQVPVPIMFITHPAKEWITRGT